MRNGKRRRGKRQETYNLALHVLARMRRTGSSLTAAAREEHIDPRTVRKYLRAELRGRGRATKADRRRRDMLIPNSPLRFAKSATRKLRKTCGELMWTCGMHLTPANGCGKP